MLISPDIYEFSNDSVGIIRTATDNRPYFRDMLFETLSIRCVQ